MASTTSRDPATSRSSTSSAAGSSTCSQLSRISSIRRVCVNARSVSAASLTPSPARPRAEATAAPTPAPSCADVRSTNQTPSGKSVATRSAVATARVVFPQPPTPTRVTREAALRRKASLAASASRPISRVRRRGRCTSGAARAARPAAPPGPVVAPPGPAVTEILMWPHPVTTALAVAGLVAWRRRTTAAAGAGAARPQAPRPARRGTAGRPAGKQPAHPRSARPARRQHVLLPRPFPQRLGRQHGFQFHQRALGMAAGQQRADEGLGQLAVQLLQPGHRGGRPRFVTPGRQRPAPPQFPGRLRPGQRLVRLSGRQQLGGLSHQRGEPHRVNLLSGDRQPVTAGFEDQPPSRPAAAPLWFEEPAQPVQMRVQRRLRPGRTPIPPHRLDQLADINPPPRINQQPGQQPAQNRPPRRPHLPLFGHIDRPEVAEPQHVPLRRRPHATPPPAC